MKVIGQTKDGSIVEISKDELAQIAGFYSDYSMRDRRKKDVEIGDEFEIGKMYTSASETLEAYGSVREKFESTQAKISVLLGFMKPEEKKGK